MGKRVCEFCGKEVVWSRWYEHISEGWYDYMECTGCGFRYLECVFKNERDLDCVSCSLDGKCSFLRRVKSRKK